MKKIKGELEIDSARGVIYFHSAETGKTVLRISQLPAPIPIDRMEMLDVTSDKVNWKSDKHPYAIGDLS